MNKNKSVSIQTVTEQSNFFKEQQKFIYIFKVLNKIEYRTSRCEKYVKGFYE